MDRKPITSLKGEITTLKKMLELSRESREIRQLQATTVGRPKKIIKIKINVIFFLFAVRKPY